MLAANFVQENADRFTAMTVEKIFEVLWEYSERLRRVAFTIQATSYKSPFGRREDDQRMSRSNAKI